MEKHRTAGRLIILRPCPAAGRLVISLQERQRHWQFALQFLFAALHGQQPRPLFRAQAPLHGQETSTDPCSYSTRMANFNVVWIKTWWINIFTFLGKLARIFRFLFSNDRYISVYILGIYKINGFIWFHTRIKTYSTVLNRIILTSSPNSTEKTQKLSWDNVTR